MSGLQGSYQTPYQPPEQDDLTLIIDNQAWQGWQEIKVTRSVESVPASFDISATEKYPGQIGDVAISAGSTCQIQLGGDLVLVGYVDRVMPSIDAGNHTVRLQGRSASEDIVDCSVTTDAIPHLEYNVTDLVALAQKVISVFPGIPEVKSLAGATIPMNSGGGGLSGTIPIQIIFGETGYELIERIARYCQILVYDDTDGSIILASVGQGGTHSSGFQEGVNVQRASGTLSMDQRYSKYIPSYLSYQVWTNGGSDPNSGSLLPPVYDQGVPRFRPLYVVSEQITADQPFAVKRAQWEMARRLGRSQAVRMTCDSWRDSAGTLWTPNAYASVSIPSIKMVPSDPWIVGEVTYMRDLERGTTAEILLMPPQAYTQEAEALVPFGWYQPGAASGGASTPPTPSGTP
jgi:prophage tail gpP-like protein